MPEDVRAELTQHPTWRSSVTLRVEDDHLHLLRKEGDDEMRGKMPLSALDENTMGGGFPPLSARILFYVAVALFATAVIAGILAIGVSGDGSAGVRWATAAVALAAGIGVLFYSRTRPMRRVVWLFNRMDGSMILDLAADDPDEESVQIFLDVCLGEAERLSKEMEEQALLSAERLNTANEIRKFHDLMKDGVIEEREFVEKKRELLDGFMNE